MIFAKPSRKIERIFVHCSASDIPAHDNIETIRDWHTTPDPNDPSKPWSDIGYHYVITKDGEVHEGRRLSRKPAAQGGHNSKTIAICLTGLNEFSEAQFNSLRALCLEVNNAYSGEVTFHGHKEVAAKACPVFDYKTVLELADDGRMSVDKIQYLPIKKEKSIMETKPGYKTTEFWLAIVTSIVTFLNQSDLLGSFVLPVESIAGVAGIIITYIISRTFVKSKSGS